MLPTKRPPTSPGKMLKFFLDEMNITQAKLANHLDWTEAKVSQLIKDKRGITPEIALSLADAIGNDAQFWLNVQQKWELWHAHKKHKTFPPIQEAS